MKPFSQDLKLLKLGKITEKLDSTKKAVHELQKCKYMGKLASKAQESLCFNGMSFLFVALFGLVLIATSMLFFAFSSFKYHRTELKKDENFV